MGTNCEPLSSVMSTGEWSGRRCFIIGGGPSLRGFNFEQLRGELVIAINRAYTCGIATLVVGADRGFWREALKDPVLRAHPRKVFLSDDTWGLDVPVYRVRLRQMFAWGKTLEEGVGAGPDSGYRALNLADILGASPIGLLGIDMRGASDGKQEWWHEGYPRRQSNTVYTRFARAYTDAWKLKAIRGDVYNLSPSSALECFPKTTLEEFLTL